MEQLRTIWTAEDAERLGLPPEAVAESATVDRYPPEGAASGEDHRAGTEEQREDADEATGGQPSLPPDPLPVQVSTEEGGTAS